MGLDHLGVHTYYVKPAWKTYSKSVEETGCAPPFAVDARRHLNGPFVSLRKVQKQHEECRLQALERRREKLRKLLDVDDRKQYQKELVEQGLSLAFESIF